MASETGAYSPALAAAAARSPLESPPEPSDALHTHNARPGLVLSLARAAGRGPGGGGSIAGMWGGGELASPALRSSLSEKFHQLRSTAGGSPSRGTLGRQLRIGAKFAALSASRREMLVGGDWYARDSAPSKVCWSPPSLVHLAAWTQLPKFRQFFFFFFSGSINSDDARIRSKEGQV